MISRVAPREMHNLTISFTAPNSFAVGSGLVPLFLGFLGDRLSFSFGFLAYGALLTAGAVLPSFLKLENEGRVEPKKKTKNR